MLISRHWLALITFPGVIAHEMAHLFFCQLAHVRVHRVCFFRLGTPSGYVVHDVPTNPWSHILIATGPFLFNSLLALGLSVWNNLHRGYTPIAAAAFIWLSISLAMHAFPSVGDAKSLWQVARGRRTSCLLKLAAIPIVLLIYLCALGTIVWLDLIYALGLTLFVARWLTSSVSIYL